MREATTAAGLKEEGGEITLLNFFSSLPLASSCWRSLLVDQLGEDMNRAQSKTGKGTA